METNNDHKKMQNNPEMMNKDIKLLQKKDVK